MLGWHVTCASNSPHATRCCGNVLCVCALFRSACGCRVRGCAHPASDYGHAGAQGFQIQVGVRLDCSSWIPSVMLFVYGVVT